MQLVLMPAGHVAEVWPLAQPFLSRAEQRGAAMQRHEEWLGECINGEKQLWLVWGDDKAQGAVVTYLCQPPRGKTCVIDAFGALTGSDWHPLLSVIEAWAKTQKCNRVRVYGRVGWTEKLKDYALKGVILDKEL